MGWPKKLGVRGAREAYPRLWEKASRLLPELDPEQTALVVSLAGDTCQACKERDGGCQCWNDE